MRGVGACFNVTENCQARRVQLSRELLRSWLVAARILAPQRALKELARRFQQLQLVHRPLHRWLSYTTKMQSDRMRRAQAVRDGRLLRAALGSWRASLEVVLGFGRQAEPGATAVQGPNPDNPPEMLFAQQPRPPPSLQPLPTQERRDTQPRRPPAQHPTYLSGGVPSRRTRRERPQPAVHWAPSLAEVCEQDGESGDVERLSAFEGRVRDVPPPAAAPRLGLL